MDDFQFPFITLKSFKGKNKINISVGILTLLAEEDGGLSCYLPGFDIYFSATDKRAAEKKAYALTRMYCDHFALHRKGGVKALYLELHRLGFTTGNENTDNAILGRIMLNNPTNATFESYASAPFDFEDAEVIKQKAVLTD